MSDRSSFVELAARWRCEAELFARRGLRDAATLLESTAADLEDLLRAAESELLNLTQAATLSGYSREHLGRRVRDGKISNAGRPGAPRIARKDLPIKASVAHASSGMQLGRTQIVRSAIEEGD